MDANVNANAMDIGSGSGSVPIVSAACRRMAVEKRQRGKTDADARGARRDALKRRENWGRLDWIGRVWVRVDVEGYIWKEKTGWWCEWGREGPGARAGDGRRAMGDGWLLCGSGVGVGVLVVGCIDGTGASFRVGLLCGLRVLPEKLLRSV
jgi:hypothetical protein